MKKNIITLLIFSVFAFIGCTKDSPLIGKYTDNPPEIRLENAEIRAKVGDKVMIKASLKDDFILKFATLSSSVLGIDEYFQISKRGAINKPSTDVIRSEYELKYKFTVPASVTVGETYPIDLFVKNGTGQSSTAVFNLKVIE